jgi:serine/threonine protein kinase
MNAGPVDRYKIRSPLRCDGVGSLDCAEDVESGMRMAIRWLPLEANGDAAAKTVEKLPTHPRLPKICSVGKVGSAAYVAMEYPEGKLLSALLQEPLSASDVRQLGAEMADALATVHADGAFHGEISADSILMLPGGRAILWDVPLVIANRLTDRRAEERFMRQLMHMASFIAPERARGCPASAAADVYALGAVLCVAAGAPLPPEDTTLAVVHRIATGQWTPHVPAPLPQDLKQVLERMLRPEPQERPTARDAVALLLAPPVAESPSASAPALPAVALEVVAPAPAPSPPSETPVSATPPAAAEPGPVAPEPAASKGPTPHPLAATIKVANPFPNGFPASKILRPQGQAKDAKLPTPPPLPSIRVTEPEMREVRAPAAVVAPSIEVATDQIKPADVQVIERAPDPGPPELSEMDFEEVASHKPPLVWGLAAGFGGLLLAGTLVVILNYPHGPPSAPAHARAPAKVASPGSPSPGLAADEDLVEPLAPASKPVAGPAKRFHPTLVASKRHAPPAPTAVAPARPASSSAPAAPQTSPQQDRDFGFLSTDAQAPKSQLKRPSY